MFFQQAFPGISKAFVLSTLPLTLLLPTAAKAADLSAKFDNIYVFGDSLSDDGNLYKADGGNYPQSPPYFNGRFSNGQLWVEYLATDLGLTPNSSTNFAFGGSSSGLGNAVLPSLPVPGLLGQVNGFTSSLQATNQKADPNALYVVWAGADDYLFGGVTDVTKPVNNLSTAITSLATAGAKNIMVVNLANLGTLPATRGDSQISSGLSTLTSAHNSGLAATLDGLSQKLSPDTKIIPLDVNSLFDRAIANPGEFGFTNVTDSCLVNNAVCDNPNNFLFWDGYHPTTAGHELVADLAFSTLEPAAVSEPSDGLGVLALGALGAVAAYKRKQKKPCQTTTACSKLLKS